MSPEPVRQLAPEPKSNRRQRRNRRSRPCLCSLCSLLFKTPYSPGIAPRSGPFSLCNSAPASNFSGCQMKAQSQPRTQIEPTVCATETPLALSKTPLPTVRRANFRFFILRERTQTRRPAEHPLNPNSCRSAVLRKPTGPRYVFVLFELFVVEGLLSFRLSVDEAFTARRSRALVLALGQIVEEQELQSAGRAVALCAQVGRGERPQLHAGGSLLVGGQAGGGLEQIGLAVR